MLFAFSGNSTSIFLWGATQSMSTGVGQPYPRHFPALSPGVIAYPELANQSVSSPGYGDCFNNGHMNWSNENHLEDFAGGSGEEDALCLFFFSSCCSHFLKISIEFFGVTFINKII